jgi:ribosomal protein S18 acetylase RimI-like enzyme
MLKGLKFRTVERKDLDEVWPLLNQLTEIDYEQRCKDDAWQRFISNNSSNSVVGVYESKIVAYGAVVIENKIRGELAGHIEDIVVDKSMRGKNIGMDLIKELIKIGNNKGCYRITLFCDKPLLNFYKKNGFNIKENEIALKKYIK